MRLKNDFRGKAVLVTGGTKGIGLAIGRTFGTQGADVYLTHCWDSADQDAVRRSFEDVGAATPRILEADASQDADTERVLETIAADHDKLAVFVSNVSFAQVGDGDPMTYRRRHLLRSLEYSAWPFVGIVQKVHARFGCYPRYTLGISGDGPDTYYPGYDFVAASKAVMESFCRYMAKEMFESERACVNVLRSRPVSTDSLRATFGEEFEPFLRRYHGDDFFVDADQVAQVALGLCSGLLDAMTGQVVMVDQGVAFQDNLMRLFQHREEYGLTGKSSP